ncbi:MAG: hypothetical protein ACE5MK_01695 [Acidobacteriota bacterium]
MRLAPKNAEATFSAVLEIDIARTPTDVNHLRLYRKTGEPISKGDVLSLSFFARSIHSANDTGTGLITAALQKDWRNRIFYREFSLGSEWKRYYLRAISPADFSTGEATFSFLCGYRPQKILIAEIKLINFGKQLRLNHLPAMPVTYRGMDAKAIWRKKAWQRRFQMP